MQNKANPPSAERVWMLPLAMLRQIWFKTIFIRIGILNGSFLKYFVWVKCSEIGFEFWHFGGGFPNEWKRAVTGYFIGFRQSVFKGPKAGFVFTRNGRWLSQGDELRLFDLTQHGGGDLGLEHYPSSDKSQSQVGRHAEPGWKECITMDCGMYRG